LRPVVFVDQAVDDIVGAVRESCEKQVAADGELAADAHR
jgi:hypothetical protein